MNIRRFTNRLFPMALAIGLCLPLAYAHASTPVEFDPDGQGGGGAFTIGSLDWLPGSTVIKDEIPLEDDSTVSAQAYAHSALAAAVDPDGIVINPPGLNVSYEITAFLANGVEITTNLDGTVVLLALDPANGDNSFEMYYDDNPNANPLGGTGFRDGHLILSGQLTALSGNFTASNQDSPFEDLDEFGANNWPGTQTISGQGSQQLAVLVQSVDKDFFPSGVDLGTILPFNNSQVVSFKQTNPSMNFSLNPGGGALDPVDTGVVNGLTGPDLLLQIDPNNAFEFIPPEQACRVTGGGNDTAGIFESGAAGWDGTVAEGLITPVVTKGNGKKSSIVALDPYRYTMGGQAGANTAQQPQPKGEWTHSNHNSPNSLKFTFHAGTASAPDGTEIDEIICTDAGFCFPARPAPNKQIDFVGIGTFKNLSWKNPEVTHSVGVVDAAFYDIQPEPVGNKPGQDPATHHWFQVHIEDLGEPGNKAEDGAVCPEKGSGNDPFADPPVTDNVADCGCGDFYHIRIYAGFNPDTEQVDKENVIYEVYGYINGGNFQIHPLTGFDLK